MILLVDIGNTRTKIANLQNNTILETWTVEQENFLNFFLNILPQNQKNTRVVISSVGKIKEEDLRWLEENTDLYLINHKSVLPFVNKYSTPETLGIDRMVLSAGAVLQFKQRNRLVIDAGTCITYDFIDQHDNYLGGSISPGLKLRYNSLNHYTHKLPLLEPTPIDYLIGDSTQKAIHSGVVNGLTQEIEGIINQYRALYPNLTIILTGGDTLFLAKRLKNAIFANSNFLLESLGSLYQYIIENDKKNSSKS